MDPNQLYSQYQLVLNQLQIYDNQVEQVSSAIDELSTNIITLEGLEKNKDNKDVVIPLGGLVLLKAQLLNIKEILLNVGSGVIVPINVTKGKDILTKRREDMFEVLKKLSDDRTQLENIANNLKYQLQSIQQQQK